jgi:hypothetical protein
MSEGPVICFGQQPCGFFPRRFLVAKIITARRLQSEIGGTIVFFYHDSDHDPRETKTTLRHRRSGEPRDFNFVLENKIQRKFSPLYAKRVEPEWHAKTARQLTEYLERRWIDAFKETPLRSVADFCLEMYGKLGLIEGITIARSSDPEFRRKACDIPDYFVDVPYEGEIVRSRFGRDGLTLHGGGDSVITLPMPAFTKEQISPARDTRLRWMDSVLHCTHYVAGAGEQAYLNKDDAPGITFVNRDPIERADEAWTEP